MIWLLVLVLLSAVNAITTPTSAAAEPIATNLASVSSKTVSFENTSGDISNSRIGVSDVHQNRQLDPKVIHTNANETLARATIGPRSRSQLQFKEQPTSSQLADLSANPPSDDVVAPNLDHHIGVKINEPHTQPVAGSVLVEPVSQDSLISNSSSINDGRSNEKRDDSHQQEPTAKNKLSQKQQQKVYTNQFVIEVKGGEGEARRLAEKHGFIYLNHILGDYYHLEHRRLAKRSADLFDMNELDISIEEEPHVLKLERQVLKRRVKRDFISQLAPPPPPHHSGSTLSDQLVENQAQLQQQQHQLHLQQQQQQQFQRPMQMLRPSGTAGRPAQFLRPANQAPGQSAGHAAYLQLDGSRLAGASSSNGRADWAGPPSSPLRLSASQQQYFDALDMNSSGPPPFFLNANYSAASAGGGGVPGAVQTNNQASSNKYRPPPPPIQMSSGNSNELQQLHHHYQQQQHPSTLGNQTSSSSPEPPPQAQSPLHYPNETARPAPFNDPSWPLMWYLDGGARNGFDLNVQAAWKMGYTGKGIVITILDDGLEKDHPDLRANYDPLASFDINSDDADPTPRYDQTDMNRHGTRCAGEVAAVPDNQICSIGIAYNSKVGGVRMLDGDVTDAVEARSLSLNRQHIHIYSASWGPDDNGKTVDGPGEMATRAFLEGVLQGRQGLGSIFVFASGNGGKEHDNCNCDGYTNAVWTLSISSATENGFVPWYTEACSSTLATTYSSGSYDERQIATTDIRHSCTSNHTGTSASAPIAAGICALVLESNPMLTWRDMQHIVVRTAKPANLIAKDWRPNALGRNVSHAFGYGLMDAAAMIQLAKRWQTVPYQYKCEIKAPKMDKIIPAKGYIELKLRVGCANVSYLEHVQSNLTVTAARRGDLHIYLTSPHGTRSTLLAQRPNDQSEQGFRYWPFMTVHSWGESPDGIWTLEVHNDGKPSSLASLKWWSLMMHGTREDPNKHLDINTITSTSTGSNNNNNRPTTPVITAPVTSSPEQQQQFSQPSSRLPSVPSRLPTGPPAPTFSPGFHADAGDTDRLMTTAPSILQQTQPKRPHFTTQAPLSTTSSTLSQLQQQQHFAGPAATQSPSHLPPPIQSGAIAQGDKPAPKLVASVTPSGGNESDPGSTTTPLSEQKQAQQQQKRPEDDVQGVQYGHKPSGDTKEANRPVAPLKADFEVVSPSANSQGAKTQSTHNYHHHHQQQQNQNQGGSVTPSSPSDSAGQSESTTTYLNNKPPVQLIDGNKIDASSSYSSTIKSPPAPLGDNSNNKHQEHENKQQSELDANQLDSKLTKDYRSSGGGTGTSNQVQHDAADPYARQPDKQRPQVDLESSSSRDSSLSSPSSSIDTFKQQQRDNSAPSRGDASQLLIGFNLILQLVLVWTLSGAPLLAGAQVRAGQRWQ